MSERFLVTGALGCIGAWTCRELLDDGAGVVAFDLGADPRRLELVLGPGRLPEVAYVRGDVADLAALERAIAAHGVTHVVHLAALLIPLVNADPPRGALVNVVGTANVFEAVRRAGLGGVSYASSSAAFARADGVRVAADADGHPTTFYGVHKQACEGLARVAWLEHGVPSVGLRPHVVYGAGRDVGLTAGPSLAMAAAARGEPYEIPFGGRMQLQLAADAARAFVEAARSPGGGASARNLGGPASTIAELVEAIEAAAPGARITYDAEVELPVPEELDGWMPVHTPLGDGVRATIEHMR